MTCTSGVGDVFVAASHQAFDERTTINDSHTAARAVPTARCSSKSVRHKFSVIRSMQSEYIQAILFRSIEMEMQAGVDFSGSTIVKLSAQKNMMVTPPPLKEKKRGGL